MIRLAGLLAALMLISACSKQQSDDTKVLIEAMRKDCQGTNSMSVAVGSVTGTTITFVCSDIGKKKEDK